MGLILLSGGRSQSYYLGPPQRQRLSPHHTSPHQAQAQAQLSSACSVAGCLAALLIKQDSRKGPWWVACARTAHMIRGARLEDIY